MDEDEMMRKFIARNLNIWIETWDDMMKFLSLCKQYRISFCSAINYMEYQGCKRLITLEGNWLKHSFRHASIENLPDSLRVLPIITFTPNGGFKC